MRLHTAIVATVDRGALSLYDFFIPVQLLGLLPIACTTNTGILMLRSLQGQIDCVDVDQHDTGLRVFPFTALLPLNKLASCPDRRRLSTSLLNFALVARTEDHWHGLISRGFGMESLGLRVYSCTSRVRRLEPISGS